MAIYPKEAAQKLISEGYTSEQVLAKAEKFGFSSGSSQDLVLDMLSYFPGGENDLSGINNIPAEEGSQGTQVHAVPDMGGDVDPYLDTPTEAPVENRGKLYDISLPEAMEPVSGSQKLIDDRTRAAAQMSARSYSPAQSIVFEGDTGNTNRDLWKEGQQDIPKHLYEEPETPSYSESAGAMMRLDNPLVSYFTRKEFDSYVIDKSYIPEEDPVLAPYLDEFYGEVARVPNAEAAPMLAAQLDQEITDRDTQARTSLLTQFTLGTALELLNPVNAPMMLVNPTAIGFKATIGMWTALGMTQEAANEILLHQTQIMRTQDESLENMLMAGGLSTVFSGAGYAFKNREDLFKSAKHMGKYIENPDEVVPPKPEKTTAEAAEDIAGVGRSGGADVVRDVERRTLDDLSIKPIMPEAVRPATDFFDSWSPDVSPITQIAKAPSLTAREFIFNVADSPLYFKASDNNRIVGNELGSIESRKNVQFGISRNVQREMMEDYKMYRQGTLKFLDTLRTTKENILKQKEEMLTEQEFMEEVFDAISIEGGKHDNKHVMAAAKRMQARLKEQLDDYVSTGMLDEKLKEKDTKKYAPHEYETDRIRANPEGFIDDVTDHINNKVTKAFIDSEKARGKLTEAQLDHKLFEGTPLPYTVRDEMQARANDAELDIAEAQAEIGRIKTEVDADQATRAKKNELTTKINELEDDLHEVTQDLKELTTPLGKLNEHAKHIDSKIAEWKAKGEKAKGRSNALKNWNEKKVDNDKALAAYKEEYMDDIDALNQDYDEISSKVKELKVERKALPSETREVVHQARNKAERDRLNAAKVARREALDAIDKEQKKLAKARKEDVAKSQRQVDKLQKRYDKAEKKADVTPEEMRIIATEIKDNILGRRYGSDLVQDYVPDLPIFEAGATRQRTLDMDYDVKKKWLNRNAADVLESYTVQMTPRNEWYRDYSGLSMDEINKRVRLDLEMEKEKIMDNLKAQNATAEKISSVTKKLDKYEDDLLKYLADQQKISLGEFGMPKDPNSLRYRGAQTVKKMNVMRLLGQVLFSAVPDTARSAGVQGAPRYFNMLKTFATNPELRKHVRSDLQQMGQIVEMISNSRAYSLVDIDQHKVYNTKGERWLDNASSKFMKHTGLPLWNDTMKMIAASVIQDHTLRTIMKPSKNKRIAKRDTREMRQRGISEEMEGRIKKHIQKHGTKDQNVWLSNTEEWTKGLEGREYIEASEAAQAFRSAIQKQTNEIIVTPGEGDMPHWMREHPIATVMTQFKSFIVAAHSRMLIPALQHMDRERLQAITLGLFLAGLSYQLKQSANGRETSDDPRVWAWEMMDRSGYMAFNGEIFEMSSRFTGGAVDPKAWTTGEAGFSRFQSRDQAALWLGPSADWYPAFVAAGRGAFTDDMTNSDKAKIRRMVPAQNMPYFSWLFDMVEDAWKE